jgi:hypothetical protein
MRKLIVKGREIASARVRTGGSAQEKYAGEELAKYLGKFGIPEGDDLRIDVHVDPALPKEGYAVRPEEDGTLSIRGGGPRGVIYGVYGFLEHYAGTRFFMPGLEKLGEGDVVVDEAYSFAPVFEQRRCDWPCGSVSPDWCVKNGVNDPLHSTIPDEMGGNFRYVKGAFCHSMAQLAGVSAGEQPCLSDPEVLKRVISNVREILKEQPDASILSVTQNDNGNYCKCPKCAAVDEEEGSHAGTLLRFVNAVADDVAADYPDLVIDTFAYMYSRKAPKITKARPNVCVRICSIECCRSHTLYDYTCWANRDFARDLKAWSAICDRIYIWDYVIGFGHYVAPYPNFHVLRDNMRFYAENSVRGMYPEGNYNSPSNGEFGELRCYLLAKLMMDPFMSEVEYYALMDEFLEAYYGAGWRYVRAFLDWTCAEVVNAHLMIGSMPLDNIPGDRWLPMTETLDGWWDKAEEMAGDRVEYVRRSRLQWTYMKLMIRPDHEAAVRLYEDLAKWQIRVREGADWTVIHTDLEGSFPDGK